MKSTKEPYMRGFDGSRTLNIDPRVTVDRGHRDLITFEGRNIQPYLELVREQVGYYLDQWGLSSELSHRLFSAGQEKLLDILIKNPEPAKAYVRDCLKKAISREKHNFILVIPRETRRRWKASGKEFIDRKRHSLDTVFDGNGLKSTMPPHWQDAESQWHAFKDHWAEQRELIEAYELLYSCCRDDLDRRILEARWQGGLSITAGMLHRDDVAAIVGKSAKLVQHRLNVLESRYCKATGRKDYKSPMPKGERRIALAA